MCDNRLPVQCRCVASRRHGTVIPVATQMSLPPVYTCVNLPETRAERLSGEKNHTPPCSSAELFFAEKNGVHRGKISVVDMVFLVFIGFLYPPPAWKVFLSGQKSSPKDFLSVVVVYAFFFSDCGVLET